MIHRITFTLIVIEPWGDSLGWLAALLKRHHLSPRELNWSVAGPQARLWLLLEHDGTRVDQLLKELAQAPDVTELRHRLTEAEAPWPRVVTD